MSGSLFGQITGKITDNGGNGLPGAAVALYQESTLVTGTSADENGVFSLTIEPGIYSLEVSFISFATEKREVTVPSNGLLNLGTITLRESSNNLGEVVVEGEANFMEFKQDKRVFNVGKDLSNVGSNASELLRNIPSVDVDIDGNVSLRGSQNVRILIDGKPSGLVGVNPADALRQLQSSMIERVEVITNPSARYDAEGEAGIINIVLKKEKRNGLNGTFEGNVGYPDNYGISTGINYRRGPINFFANLSFNYRNSPGGGSTLQRTFYDDTTFSFVRDREQTRGGYSGALRLGADYNLSENQTLTGNFLYRPSLENNEAVLRYKDYNGLNELTQTSVRIDQEEETERTLEGDLHYAKTLKGKDHKWTADFKYQDSDDRESSDIFQTVDQTGELTQQKVENQEDEQSILIQTDYVKPLSGKKSFEIGAKGTLRKIVNNYSVRQLEDGIFENLPRYTNDFTYLENIYAAYAIYNGELKDITYQLGLRSEYTDLSTALRLSNEPVRKQYLNLFPSVFFTWDIGVKSDLQWSYSRRISRPHFRMLLPFSNFSDNRNFFAGNPDLNPEFTDSYEMGYVRYWEKASLYSGVYYRHRTGVIERITLPTDTNANEIFPINLGVQDAYGLEFNLSLDLYKWWKANANLNVYRALTRGTYREQQFNSDNLSAQSRIMNRFSFWKSDLQVSFNLRAPETTTQGTTLGIYTMDLGWSRDILNNRATISASVRDVFSSRKRRSITEGPDFYIESDFQWRARQFLLSFTYRLNQKKSRPQGDRDGDFGDDFGM
ncbi:MAG TPA: TonB-dependent receptor [Cryomorphaceae bacterium]|nr:TonB-dependent receptor [Cryomorphaceae bacterium]